MMSMAYGFRVRDAGRIERLPWWVSVLCLLLVSPGQPALGAQRVGQGEIWELRQQGHILSLTEILARGGLSSGRLIKTELERKDGRLIYELEYLLGGEVRELTFDARTGDLLGEGRG